LEWLPEWDAILFKNPSSMLLPIGSKRPNRTAIIAGVKERRTFHDCSQVKGLCAFSKKRESLGVAFAHAA
jgi:hypothetical protein